MYNWKKNDTIEISGNDGQRYFYKDGKIFDMLKNKPMIDTGQRCNKNCLVCNFHKSLLVKRIQRKFRQNQFKKFIKQSALRNRIRNEIEMYPNVGVKYFEIKEHFENLCT